MSGVTQSTPGLGPSSPDATTPVYNNQAVVATQSDSLLRAPLALRGQDMGRSSERRPQSILISRTPSPLFISPPPLPTFKRDPLSDDPAIHATRSGSSSSSSISSDTFASSSSSSSEDTIDATDSPSSSLRTSAPSSPSQRGKDSPLRQLSPVLSPSPSITFAPLPNIEPRTRKSNRGPLGVAARGAILRERRQQMLLMQGRGHLDGIDGVDDVPSGLASDSCNSGSGSSAGGKSSSRARSDPLVDESDDAILALGKMLNDAGRMLWKRMNVASLRRGKSKSKTKNESFDIATIRAEDELAAQIDESSAPSNDPSKSPMCDEARHEYVAGPHQVEALSEAELKALSSPSDMGATAPMPIVVT